MTLLLKNFEHDLFAWSAVLATCCCCCYLIYLSIRQYMAQTCTTPHVAGLPWIGSLLALLDPHASILRTQARHGDYFTFHLLRSKFHMVLDPHLITRVLCHSRDTLSFRETERFIDLHYFDYPAQLTVCDNDTQFRALEECIAPHLLSAAGIAQLNDAVWRALVSRLAHDARDDDVLELDDLFVWVRAHVFAASTASLFGPACPSHELAALYWTWEADLTDFLTLPHALLARHRRDRARLVRKMADLIGDREALRGCSGIIADRVALARQWGYPPEDQAKVCLDILFALQANATPMAFWMLAHVLTHEATRNRVYEMTRGQDGEDMPALRECIQDDWITSLYDESLRMHAHATILRKCMRPTQIGPHRVEPGEFVVVPIATYQHSPHIWRDPYVFDEGRFARLAKGEESAMYGKLKKTQVLLSFGGGQHYCPGRHFAKVEIVAMTLLVCKMYRVVELDPLPDGWNKRKYGNGTQQPMSKMRVKLQKVTKQTA